MKFKLNSKTAKAPKRSTIGSAGYDLFADTSCELLSFITVDHGGVTPVETSVSVEIPYGYVGFIKPRSGLAFRDGVDTMAGVIDSDYRGTLRLLLTCHELHPLSGHTVNHGDKIAQLVILPCDMSPVEIVDELSDPNTRNGGFGSTGND